MGKKAKVIPMSDRNGKTETKGTNPLGQLMTKMANGLTLEQLMDGDSKVLDAMKELGIKDFDDLRHFMDFIGIDAEKATKGLFAGEEPSDDPLEFAHQFMKDDFVAGLEEELEDEDDDYNEDEDDDDDEGLYDNGFDVLPYHIKTYFHDVPAKEFHLRFKLNNAPVEIWREIKVPSNISLELLAYLIEEVMGWGHEHLHQFHADDCNYCSADELKRQNSFILPMRIPQRDANKYHLADIFREKGKRIVFEYDFGDSWYHDVWLKGTRDYNPDDPQVLKVVKGTGQCPPEDCGGVWGYKSLLELRSKKRKTADEKERLEWYGIDKHYDPDYYDLDEEQCYAEELWEDLLSTCN